MAHKGQYRKDYEEYINHPIRVALGCKTDNQKIVALLHDVLEDTSLREHVLIYNGFDYHDIVRPIQILTKEKDVNYQTYLDRVWCDETARIVKLSDLRDNMDISRLGNLTEYQKERQLKYENAYKFLTET